VIDRATGRARSFKVDAVDGRTIIPIIRKNIAKETVMMTDDAGHYKHLARAYGP
jgi:transposase-like protein